MAYPWNYTSQVAVCGACEGTGKVASHRRPTIDDPYPETDCDCGLGEHEPECQVCGYNMPVQGYDCLACDTVAGLYESELKAFDAAAFAAAVAVAVEKAKADCGRLAA